MTIEYTLAQIAEELQRFPGSRLYDMGVSLEQHISTLKDFGELIERHYPSGTWTQRKLNEIVATGAWTEEEGL